MGTFTTVWQTEGESFSAVSYNAVLVFLVFMSCVSLSTLKISLGVVQSLINFERSISRQSIIYKNREHIGFTKMNILTQTVFFISDSQPGF